VEIIPVVDLKGGCVVHARRGDRARYQPLISSICVDADPLHVVSAMLTLFSPHRLYVADLDAITGASGQHDLIAALSRLCRHAEIWLDSGFRSISDLSSISDLPNIVPVIGSETLDGIDTYLRLRSQRPDAVLSLDFRGETFLGPPVLLASPDLWCQRLVHLDLSQVGASQGPAAAMAMMLQDHAPDRAIYVGGGVRHIGDLRHLAGVGIRGALVATALHDGSIQPGHLCSLHAAQHAQ
jgi:phosphoribosylformimino-5-aminoimidazole carboxamide ribotide isomerase